MKKLLFALILSLPLLAMGQTGTLPSGSVPQGAASSLWNPTTHRWTPKVGSYWYELLTMADTTSLIQTIPNFYPKGDIRWLRRADSTLYPTMWQFLHGNNTITGAWDYYGTNIFHNNIQTLGRLDAYGGVYIFSGSLNIQPGADITYQGVGSRRWHETMDQGPDSAKHFVYWNNNNQLVADIAFSGANGGGISINGTKLAKEDAVATKADTSVTNNLNLFNNAKKTNYYEVAKANAPHIHNIYIKPYANPDLRVGVSRDDGFTTEYRFLKNTDGIFITNGVYIGKTVPASVPQVALWGSFNTGSTNTYTTTAGNKFTVSFTGNSFSFNTFEDNRGGIWSFYLSPTADYPTGVYRSFSVYNSGTVSSITIPVFTGLKENNYTVTATFTGADPLNPPSGGTARGWLKYSAATPQTVAYTSLTGVIDPINQITILPTGTIDDLAINFRKLGTTDSLRWVLYHGVTNATRNIATRIVMDDKTAIAPDSITSTLNGISKVQFVQTYDAYYPTNSLKMWGGKLNHNIDDNGLMIINDITMATDSCQAGSSYIAMVSGDMRVVNKLTVGDTTYNIAPPVSGQTTVNIKNPSENFKYEGTWAGQNWQIAAHVNLANALDYPKNKYLYGKNFFTERTISSVAKMYYNISGLDTAHYRTFKNGDHLVNSTQIFIGRVPAVTDSTRRYKGVTVTMPSSGGLGIGIAPTGAQLPVGNQNGIYYPRTVSGVMAIDSAGVTSFSSFSSATLSAALTDETGTSGGFVRANSPTLVAPILGAATVATVNKVTITAPVTGSTLTIANGATLQQTGAFVLNNTLTANSTPTYPAGAGTLVYSSTTPQIQASANLTAQTSTGNITTFTVGAATATFNVSAYINVTAISTDVIQAQVTYTDENNTSQTVSFTTISTVTNSTYSPVTIRAKNGTVITVKSNLTVGGGTVTFDAGATIIQN